MTHTASRRTGRLRALVVVSALAVSMVAAAIPASANDAPPGHDRAPGLDKTVEARNNAPAGPWKQVDDGNGGFTPQGWSWR